MSAGCPFEMAATVTRVTLANCTDGPWMLWRQQRQCNSSKFRICRVFFVVFFLYNQRHSSRSSQVVRRVKSRPAFWREIHAPFVTKMQCFIYIPLTYPSFHHLDQCSSNREGKPKNIICKIISEKDCPNIELFVWRRAGCHCPEAWGLKEPLM